MDTEKYFKKPTYDEKFRNVNVGIDVSDDLYDIYDQL